MVVSPAMHAPLQCKPSATYTPCHACPPAMYAPCHACPLPLPCMFTCHTCPPAMHATSIQTPPPVNRMTDRQVWKHYLSATSFADGNDSRQDLCIRCWIVFIEINWRFVYNISVKIFKFLWMEEITVETDDEDQFIELIRFPETFKKWRWTWLTSVTTSNRLWGMFLFFTIENFWVTLLTGTLVDIKV